MLVLLAVSLLLADCAQFLWRSGCLSVGVPVLVLWLRVSGVNGVSFLRDSCRDDVAFSLCTATVASRGAEFGLFEWSSRSLCRGAGFPGLTRRGRRSNIQQGSSQFSLLFFFISPKQFFPCAWDQTGLVIKHVLLLSYFKH